MLFGGNVKKTTKLRIKNKEKRKFISAKGKIWKNDKTRRQEEEKIDLQYFPILKISLPSPSQFLFVTISRIHIKKE
jgi:hypothetical protein